MVAAQAGTFYGQAMTAGHIYTLAGTGTAGFSGDGGPSTRASVHHPNGLTVDRAGNLLIADSNNGRIRVIVARTGTFYRQAMTAGHIYTIAGGGTSRLRDGGPATAARLDIPYDVTIDRAGNLLIADTFHNRIRVVAARTGTFYRQAMTAGHIYTLAGTGTAGFSGEGGPATRAELNNPNCVTVDGRNLLIADRYNNRIRVVRR